MSQGFTTLTASDSLSEIVEAQIDNNSTLLSCNAGGTAPTGAALVDGALWCDTSTNPPILKQYDLDNTTWLIVRAQDLGITDDARFGTVRALAGGSSSYGYAGLSLFHDVQAIGNSGTSEEDLHSYTIPADVLETAGDLIEFEMAFNATATGTAKNIRVYFGSQVVWTSGSQIVSGALSVKGTIYQISTSQQTSIVTAIASDSLWGTTIDGQAPSEDETSTIVLKATAECGAAADILQALTSVKFWKKP